jgi:hypothetical protein
MKTCPTCKRSYTDDSQVFCLDDGARLINDAPAPPTPTLVSYPPPPVVQPQVYQGQQPTQPAWAPPPASAQPAFAPPLGARAVSGSRRKGLATISLVLGFVCLALMIHLTYSLIARSFWFIYPPLARVMFGVYGIEFFFSLMLVALTVVLAVAAIVMAFKQPDRYAGRGRSFAAILMGVLSTFIVVSLFTVRRAQHRPSYPITYYTPSPTPTPSSSYARDFVKPRLGAFTLIKTLTRDDVRKISSGEMLKNVDRANDVGAGIYRSSANQNLSLIVSSYSSTTTPANIVDAMEKDTNGPGWRSSRTFQKTNGKQVQAESPSGGALVVWNNGHWLFITYAPTMTDAVALAGSVGY